MRAKPLSVFHRMVSLNYSGEHRTCSPNDARNDHARSTRNTSSASERSGQSNFRSGAHATRSPDTPEVSGAANTP